MQISAGTEKREVKVRYIILSSNIRYGVAESTDVNDKTYFAFYGYPNRNEDYFEITQITEDEYLESRRDFGGVDNYLTLDQMASEFKARYIENRSFVYTGWDLPDAFWIE